MAKLSGLGVTVSDLVLAGEKLRADITEAVTGATLIRTIEGASTVELTVRDWDRKLLRSKLFQQRSLLTVDDLKFELVAIAKGGDELQLTFEAALVADLRRRTGGGSQKPGLSRGRYARRLVRSSPGARFRGPDGAETKTTLSVGKNEDRWTGLRRLADEVQVRVFEDAGAVWFAADDWLRSQRGPVAELREHTGGVDTIDFDWDAGKRVAEARLIVNMERWALPPGTPASTPDLGPAAAAKWLVGEIRRPFHTTQGEVSLVARRPALPEPEPPPPPKDYSDPAGAGGGSVNVGKVSGQGFMWPAKGTVVSEFGAPRPGRIHLGIDIANSTGTPLRASADGTVTFSGSVGGYGAVVYVSHGGGWETRYAHASRLLVSRGARVSQGQTVALMGATGNATGPHIHFEIRRGGSAINPRQVLP